MHNKIYQESEADDSKEEKAEKDYVYDLYYINDQTFNYEYLDNICKFQATQLSLIVSNLYIHTQNIQL